MVTCENCPKTQCSGLIIMLTMFTNVWFETSVIRMLYPDRIFPCQCLNIFENSLAEQNLCITNIVQNHDGCNQLLYQYIMPESGLFT